MTIDSDQNYRGFVIQPNHNARNMRAGWASWQFTDKDFTLPNVATIDEAKAEIDKVLAFDVLADDMERQERSADPMMRVSQ